MAGDEAPRGERPDLVAEARFWREWNTSVYEKTHPRAEAEAMVARSYAPCRPPPADRNVLVQVHADSGRFYQSRVPGSWVPGYLASRRLEAVLLPTSPWKIGYAPRSWTALTGHLRSLGYSDEVMLRSGLVTAGKDGKLRDRFRDRLMVPVRRPSDGVVIAFIGRRHPAAGDDRGPKYLNSPNTELYVKGHVLAGIAEGQRHLDAGAQPVLVEGLTDAFAVGIAAPGRYVGLPLCGTALTPEHVAALAHAVDLPEHGVRLALDPDDAGRKAAVRAYAGLSACTSDLTAVIFPGGHDPAEMLQHNGAAALRDALTSSVCPLAEIVIDSRMSPWASDGEFAHTGQQTEALRSAGRAIAGMSRTDATAQAIRLADLFTSRYGWHRADVYLELTDGLERQLFAENARGTAARERATLLPSQTSAAVARASAPYAGAGVRQLDLPQLPEPSRSVALQQHHRAERS
jgi:DNA primase catalytic core